MNYDLEERFRLDTGETDLSAELQAELDMEQQQAQEAAALAQVEQQATTPTGAEQPSPESQAAPTGEAQ